MVQMTVTASVRVDGGPVIPLNAALDPESYTYASVALAADGEAGDTQDVALLPDGGTPVLLAIRAVTGSSAAATVTLTARNGGNSSAPLTVTGQLLVANASVLDALVAKAPRLLTIKNEEAAPATVDILTGLDLTP